MTRPHWIRFEKRGHEVWYRCRRCGAATHVPYPTTAVAMLAAGDAFGDQHRTCT